MSPVAWLLAIPQFIIAAFALCGSIRNHRMALNIKDRRIASVRRVAVRSSSAIVVLVAYFPATIGWILDQPADFMPSISTIACFLWDFCVFFWLLESVRISSDELGDYTGKRTPCRPCPYRELLAEHDDNQNAGSVEVIHDANR